MTDIDSTTSIDTVANSALCGVYLSKLEAAFDAALVAEDAAEQAKVGGEESFAAVAVVVEEMASCDAKNLDDLKLLARGFEWCRRDDSDYAHHFMLGDEENQTTDLRIAATIVRSLVMNFGAKLDRAAPVERPSTNIEAKSTIHAAMMTAIDAPYAPVRSEKGDATLLALRSRLEAGIIAWGEKHFALVDCYAQSRIPSPLLRAAYDTYDAEISALAAEMDRWVPTTVAGAAARQIVALWHTQSTLLAAYLSRGLSSKELEDMDFAPLTQFHLLWSLERSDEVEYEHSPTADDAFIDPHHSVDDLNSDIHHLRHLIDQCVDLMTEDVDYLLANGEQNKELERASALMWIARDMADKIAEQSDAVAGLVAQHRADTVRQQKAA